MRKILTFLLVIGTLSIILINNPLALSNHSVQSTHSVEQTSISSETKPLKVNEVEDKPVDFEVQPTMEVESVTETK